MQLQCIVIHKLRHKVTYELQLIVIRKLRHGVISYPELRILRITLSEDR